MAQKPTIYKFTIALSDLNRNYYDSLNLTVAQHPSETLERLIARILAFSIHADEHLEFTKGLFEPDDPEIIQKTLDGLVSKWIDLGEPSIDRIKKAAQQSKNVFVFSFNSKSDAWWDLNNSKISMPNVFVTQFKWADIQTLAGFVERGMSISITISDNSAYVATDSGELNVEWKVLKG